jgi:uncharacterized repeat protein (TIGR01451 family)
MRAKRGYGALALMLVAALVIGLVGVVATPGDALASPKSMYLVPTHWQGLLDAWNINADGTATYQATHNLLSSDPAGVAIDEDTATLMITSEFSGGVEFVDATTMTPLGVSAGPSDLAGIAVDEANDIVYTVERYTNQIFVYDWNPAGPSLTLKAGFPMALPNMQGAFGCSLDEPNGILWVSDTPAGVARAYDVNTWVELVGLSFSPSHLPVDITVDRLRGIVYTVSMSAGAFTPPGSGSLLLSKYDLATSTETTGPLPDQGVGIAVDELTGYVYVTISPYGGGGPALEAWDTSTGPWTLIQHVAAGASPAGICIPQDEVVYNPLHLTKDDGLGGQCVIAGDTIAYQICYDNLGNIFDVTNVTLVDNLPPEVTFVSASASGIYDPVTHTVSWNIGTLPAGDPGGCVTVTVTVNPGVVPGNKITNSVTIDADPPIPPTTVNMQTDICTEPVVPVPGMTEWGIIATVAILGTSMVLMLRRRRAYQGI